ncbi:MAG: TetR/AcrR family transcriptional regulator [Burkholderiaceae bacterium]
MRVPREVAEKNRSKVVETAGSLFREHGFDGIGVAALMQAAGMTHGGFYKQFSDKAALAVEATEAALAENRANWSDVLNSAPSAPVETLTQWYLAPTHARHRAHGCAFAALAAEAPRQGKPMQQVFSAALEKSIALFHDAGLERHEALRQLSLMVGALILARAAHSKTLAREILEAAQFADDSGED